MGFVGTQKEMLWEVLAMETSPVCSAVFTMARKINRNSFADNGGRKVRKQPKKSVLGLHTGQHSEWVRQVLSEEII